MRFIGPILAGCMSAAAWTMWTQAVAAGRPIETAVSELALIGVCWFTWGWYSERKFQEWWIYAVSSAVASGFVVWMGGK